jgi:hypothetical protein
MTSARVLRAATVAVGLAAALPSPAAAGIPVRVRILKGSRQGPPAIDPRLGDLSAQLGHLAYVRWDQVGESQSDMDFGKPWQLRLPDGSELKLTLLESRKDTVTFEVDVPAHRTHSRLTISKDKRIVHQVSIEKRGEAYFVSIRPWP